MTWTNVMYQGAVISYHLILSIENNLVDFVYLIYDSFLVQITPSSESNLALYWKKRTALQARVRSLYKPLKSDSPYCCTRLQNTISNNRYKNSETGILVILPAVNVPVNKSTTTHSKRSHSCYSITSVIYWVNPEGVC